MAEQNEAYLSKGGDIKSVAEFSAHEKAVCKLEIGGLSGTGFYVHLKVGGSFKLGLMSCFHVAAALLGPSASAMKAIFNYNYDDGGGDVVALRPEIFVYHEPTLDFIFCGVDHEHLKKLGIEPIPCLVVPPPLEAISAEQSKGTIVTIIQHANGWAKTWSTQILYCVNRPFFAYYADTAPGSSGAPVFAHVSGQSTLVLVGIHKSGNSQKGYNEGILVDEIISFLSTGEYTKPSTASKGEASEEHGKREELMVEVKKAKPDLEKIKSLLQTDKSLANCMDVNNDCPLHIATQNNHKELVKLLLEHDANPKVKNKFSLYPLHLAAERGFVDIAKLLIEHNADVDAFTQTEGHITPLHFAARRNKPEMVRFLVNEGAKVDAQNKSKSDGSYSTFESSTPLHYAVLEEDTFKAVKALVDCGADVTLLDHNGETAYTIASTRNEKTAAFLKKCEQNPRPEVVSSPAQPSTTRAEGLTDPRSMLLTSSGGGPVIVGDHNQINYTLDIKTREQLVDALLGGTGPSQAQNVDLSGQSRPNPIPFIDSTGRLNSELRAELLRQPWVRAYGIEVPRDEHDHSKLLVVARTDTLDEAQRRYSENQTLSKFDAEVVFKKAAPLKILPMGNVVPTSTEPVQAEQAAPCSETVCTQQPNHNMQPYPFSQESSGPSISAEVSTDTQPIGSLPSNLPVQSTRPGKKVFVYSNGWDKNVGTISLYYSDTTGHSAVMCYHNLCPVSKTTDTLQDEQWFQGYKETLLSFVKSGKIGVKVYDYKRGHYVGEVSSAVLDVDCEVGLVRIPPEAVVDDHILDGYKVSAPPGYTQTVYVNGECEECVGKLVYRDFHWNSSSKDSVPEFAGMLVIEKNAHTASPSSGCLVFHRDGGIQRAFGIVHSVAGSCFQEFTEGEVDDGVRVILCQQLTTVIESISKSQQTTINPCFDDCDKSTTNDAV